MRPACSVRRNCKMLCCLIYHMQEYAKASLLMRICPPKSVSPCAISDPATALQKYVH